MAPAAFTPVVSSDLRSASRDAQAALIEKFDSVSSGLSGDALSTLSDELASVAKLLVAEPILARHLAEASGETEAKKQLLQRLLAGKVGDTTLDVLNTAASVRWSLTSDLVDAVEHVARLSLLTRAERENQADEVEEQLFRFSRILDAQPQLTTLLGDYSKPAQGRVDLVRNVMSQTNGANATATALLAQTVDLLRGKRADEAVLALARLAVARRGEIVAQVSAAAELSDAQRTRLNRVAGPDLQPPGFGAAEHRSRRAGRPFGRRRRRGDRRNAVLTTGLSSHQIARLAGRPPPRTTQDPTKAGRRKAMAELTISADDIQGAIQDYVSSFEADTGREEIGTVIDAGDGIAHVEGLPSVMTQELLEFPGGVLGVALNLDEHSVGAVILGDFEKIEQGQQVKRTGQVLSVPVGDAFLGRVINPLGQPIDGRGDIESTEVRALELQAPSVVERQSVSEPLQTGIKAIDAMTPIGRGQRQLIIGDRKTGKTAVCVDTILNQRKNWETGDPKQQVRCVYVAIGQKGTTIASVRRSLEEGGAMDYTTIVAAPASDAAGFKWLAPYTGSAIAQHWMYDGKHVLIVFDDLSKQADAYRAISLLLRRPPGREAFPGDVFYLHSRLLERCAKLSDELGGGSLTGLPIIETKANDISAFIPTNVISITDGQCFLETDLFNQGVRPAINVGVSVSRVGGAAQIKAMKEVAGSLRLDLSQYRELEAFAAFASDLDETSKAQLERGARLVELLKQPQYSPLSVEQEVVAIFLGTKGHLDSVPVADVARFETEFLEHVEGSNGEILTEIRDSKKLSEETEEKLNATRRRLQEGLRHLRRQLGGSATRMSRRWTRQDVEKESVQVRKPAPKKK